MRGSGGAASPAAPHPGGQEQCSEAPSLEALRTGRQECHPAPCSGCSIILPLLFTPSTATAAAPGANEPAGCGGAETRGPEGCGLRAGGSPGCRCGCGRPALRAPQLLGERRARSSAANALAAVAAARLRSSRWGRGHPEPCRALCRLGARSGAAAPRAAARQRAAPRRRLRAGGLRVLTAGTARGRGGQHRDRQPALCSPLGSGG